ncbi:hypothetical protein BT67DRAFT_909 [Trichocladium antarcticum]|uniref:Uncharacterized protein n=1 Tax=Trichocladium antarcticum TaxID=1450529 RepID=A0AAN6UUM3_9PEZI|nr:hypothetical protein BT67DRAFT_909 [Trichocladium antarcticum]
MTGRGGRVCDLRRRPYENLDGQRLNGICISTQENTRHSASGVPIPWKEGCAAPHWPSSLPQFLDWREEARYRWNLDKGAPAEDRGSLGTKEDTVSADTCKREEGPCPGEYGFGRASRMWTMQSGRFGFGGSQEPWRLPNPESRNCYVATVTSF